MSEPPLPVTLFADFTSPFCFVAETALARVAASRSLDRRPRAFELYPAPLPLPLGADEAQELSAAAPLAAELGLELRPPPLRPRTGKAHEAVRFAAAHGRGQAMRDAVYRGYWSAGVDIGRIDLLMQLALEVGLDPTALKIALDIDAYREEVSADLELARRLGVSRVPTMFLGTGPTATILEGAFAPAALDEAVSAR